MFGNSLKMIKIDRNMSELWQIVCKIYNFNVSAFVGCIVWIVEFYVCKKYVQLVRLPSL